MVAQEQPPDGSQRGTGLRTKPPGEVAESVERGSRVRDIGSSVHSRVKQMTYNIGTGRFLAWCLAL